jgi:hypothetical protein
MTFHIRPAVIAGAVLAGVVGIAACGGGSSNTAASASATPSATATSSAPAGTGGAGGARNNPYANPTVQACLKAAGIAVPTFAAGARPSGSFTRPSGSFTRPSGSFTRPSGSFTRGAGGGGFGGGTDSPEFQKIQQALTACGITLPTFSRGAGGGGGAPSASATPSG